MDQPMTDLKNYLIKDTLVENGTTLHLVTTTMTDISAGMYHHLNDTNSSTMPRGGGGGPQVPSSSTTLVGVTFLFVLIEMVGMAGNLLVIYVTLNDRKMRKSVTNMFITNLAFADIFIMIFGVPDIVLFMLNHGWTLGEGMCKFGRFFLTSSLYASVMTLMALCVERFIAIVFPIKAHILCSRRRILMVIAAIWPLAFGFGLPTILFVTVKKPAPHVPIEFCMLEFPNDTPEKKYAFKYVEATVFYLLPLVVQIVLYTIIGIRLFAGTEELHRRQTVRCQNGVDKERDSDAIIARKGVVKMLVACIIVYFICYSPHQILIFYNTFSKTPFHTTWTFHVAVMALASINSATNPIMYSIFSQNFRRKFREVLTCTNDVEPARRPSLSMDSLATSRISTRMTNMSVKKTPIADV